MTTLARRLSLTTAISSLLLTMVAAPVAAAPAAAMPSDFDGDGYADLAIGVQGEDIGSEFDAGAINVLYGTSNGPAAGGDQFWSQDSPGVKGTSQGGRTAGIGNGDYFGAALASGDFDKDGYADLAIGVPSDRVGHDNVRGGAVNILYGSKSGLTATGDQLWSLANLPGVPVKHDWFGGALASGDFDGDGYWDLAIGAAGRDIGGVRQAGEVRLLYGGHAGLTEARSHALTRSSVAGQAPSREEGFGAAVAAGDVTGDGRAELAVGAPFGTFYGSPGGVGLFHGSSTGISVTGAQWWTQTSPGIDDPVDQGDRFGAALAFGDFDNDGHRDLAVGTPNIEIDAAVGKVIVLPGSVAGLTTAGSQVWDSPVGGTDDWGPEFGFALAAGDFDGNGADDLAIGAPWTGSRVGSVYVLYAGGGGLDDARAQRWSQDSVGVPGTSEDDDVFGIAVTALDFDRSGHDDLVIGASNETGHRLGSGRITVIRGRAAGLTNVGIRAWTQDSRHIRDAEEPWDRFGSTLTGSPGRPGW
ncbi:MAG TPA: hypothetical protein VIZ22_05235 [Candidatus Limnocylindrales bacterium]